MTAYSTAHWRTPGRRPPKNHWGRREPAETNRLFEMGSSLVEMGSYLVSWARRDVIFARFCFILGPHDDQRHDDQRHTLWRRSLGTMARFGTIDLVGFRPRRIPQLSLEQRIRNLADGAIEFHQEIYPSAAPKYASTSDLLTGEGALRFGGRWNPAGIAAVYGSLTPQTALEESLAHARYYGMPINTSMPRTFVAIDVELEVVLDLTDGSNRQTLRISENHLLECNWRGERHAGRKPVTQEVGQAAASAGIEAILVRSAADKSGANLVVFPENLRPASRLGIVSPDRLNP